MALETRQRSNKETKIVKFSKLLFFLGSTAVDFCSKFEFCLHLFTAFCVWNQNFYHENPPIRKFYVHASGWQSNKVFDINMNADPVAPSFSFEIFERIKPDEYFRRFIEENVRPDGRSLHAFRPTSIRQGAISTANGSAMVRIGGTTVICGIKAEVAEPRIDRPKDGYLGKLIALMLNWIYPFLCTYSLKLLHSTERGISTYMFSQLSTRTTVRTSTN